MNTLMRFSSSLSNQVAVGLQQTKDYTAKIAANATAGTLVTTATKSGTRLRDITSEAQNDSLGALEVLRTECKDGMVFFFPLGPFQRFLLQVEDIFIAHLLLHEEDFKIAVDLFKVIVYKAIEENSQDITNSHQMPLIYSLSDIARLSSYIRILSSIRPSVLFETLDSFLGTRQKILETSKPLLITKLKSQLKSFELILPDGISYFPFVDETFTEIMHLNWLQLQSVRDNGVLPKIFAIRIRRAGSAQLCGLYYPVNTDDPCYENSSGYRIQRIDMNSPLLICDNHSMYDTFCAIESTTGSAFDRIQIMPKQVYLWCISAPTLESTYYTCCSILRTPLPPSHGWRAAHCGRLPAPHLELVDDPKNDNEWSSNEESLAPSGVQYPPASPAPTSTTKPTNVHTPGSVESITSLRRRRMKRRIRSLEVRDVNIEYQDPSNGTPQSSLKSSSQSAFYDTLDEPNGQSYGTEQSLLDVRESEYKSFMQELSKAYDTINNRLEMINPREINCSKYKEIFSEKVRASESHAENVRKADCATLLTGMKPSDALRDAEDEEESAFEKKWTLEAVLLRERGEIGSEPRESDVDHELVDDDGWGLGVDTREAMDDVGTPKSSLTSAFKGRYEKDGRYEVPSQMHPRTPKRDTETKEVLEEILESGSSRFCKNLCEVAVLGVEMWASAKGTAQRLNYVFRVTMSDRQIRPLSSILSHSAIDELSGTHSVHQLIQSHYRVTSHFRRLLSAFECLGLSVGRRVESATRCSRLVLTIRRDLASLVALHAELQRLLIDYATSSYVRRLHIQPPVFPDPFHIGMIEEESCAALKESRGGAGTIGVVGVGVTVGGAVIEAGSDGKKSSYAYHPAFHRKEHGEISPTFQTCLDSLQEYLQAVFSLPALIDDCDDDDDGDESEESDLSVFAQDHSGSALITPDEQLSDQFGRLLGKFLQESDVEGLMTSTVEDRTESSPRPHWADGTGGGLGAVSSAGRDSETDRTKRAESDLKEIVRLRACLRNEAHDVLEESFRPSWYPYVTGGLSLDIRVTDDQGGKLSLRNEDELLKSQRSKCSGCGLPLTSGFLGLDRNFRPCRYVGGLFCKRWCHADEHRVIPHRLLQYWDVTPHRVSRQAADFLDSVWDEPLLNLSIINAQLYEGVPVLKQVRAMRERVVAIVGNLLSSAMVDPDSNRSDFERRVLEAVAFIIGSRLHLVTCVEQYSLDDLLRAQSGELLDRLQTLLDHLSGEHAVEMHRQKYGLGGVSTPTGRPTRTLDRGSSGR